MPLRLVFMGTPDFAVPALAELIGQGREIACVYSQPPRAKGRGLHEDPSPVHRFALANHLPVRTPSSLKDPAQQEAFAALKPDAAVVVAYGLLLPKAILEAPRLGCFNLHGSLLPRWRGAAPIQRTIMAGDQEAGVMVMRMSEGLDEGPVLMAERIAIGRKTYGEVHDELARLGASLMARALGALERGTVQEQQQAEAGVTYARKIAKDEARVDWRLPARELDCLIRGLSPVPGAWCEMPGKNGAHERVKILLAEPVAGQGEPGTVLQNGVIACGTGALKLVMVQRAGKTAQDAESFLRGFTLAAGQRLS
jgi:methionyl-tRNA formyltransferase